MRVKDTVGFDVSIGVGTDDLPMVGNLVDGKEDKTEGVCVNNNDGSVVGREVGMLVVAVEGLKE